MNSCGQSTVTLTRNGHWLALHQDGLFWLRNARDSRKMCGLERSKSLCRRRQFDSFHCSSRTEAMGGIMPTALFERSLNRGTT